jgi:tripartite-type tricarboxylate transporter receptor subunit TctC
VIDEWSRQIGAVLADPDLAAELAQMGMEAETSTPQETRERIASHLKEWNARMVAVGMSPVN